MRKTILYFLFCVFILFLFSDEIQKPIKKSKPLNTIKGRLPERSRDVPDHEFLIEPTDLMMTYYDYMPGSYNGIPVCVQPEISHPNGYEAGGVYIVYHAKATTSSNRRLYYNCINNEGIISDYATVAIDDIWEGYAGIDIDPVTADPLVVWHRQDEDHYDVISSCNMFHINGVSSSWSDPMIIIDNPYDLINPDDEFMWPSVQIGPSPDPDKRRAYIYAQNAEYNTPSGNPSGNILLVYADFDAEDLESQSDLDWTYRTIPLLDQWHNEEPWTRPFLTMIVSDDGKVAFIGRSISDDELFDENVFVFLNHNYAEEEFVYYSEDFRFDVENPFPDDPYEFYFTFSNCTHFNAMFKENNSKITFEGNFGLYGEDPDGENDVYFPYYVYPKVFTFDLVSEEFAFFDLYPQGANPDDNNPMLPWDLNEDGIPDSLDDNGNIVSVQGWPFCYHDNDMSFLSNYFHIVKNEERNWLAAVWSDGLKSKLANEGETGYEEWAAVPEITICISNNNGETWSDPIFLNSLETPELDEMIPYFIYPGDLIDDLGDNHGKLHLFFLDDYVYGFGGGWFFGNGMLKYAALDIDFGFDSAVDEIETYSAEIVLQSYPNPFHSSTTISFNVTQNSNFLNLEIYNIKGQKVKTLECNIRDIAASTRLIHSITWNGTNDNGQSLSSGIYVMKLENDRDTITKKITLIR